MTHSPRRLALVACLISFAFVVASCGDDSPAAVPQSGDRTGTTGPSIGTDEAFPVTVTADNGPVTITTRPQRILSLSPTGTEMLFAIDAGDQVVAVDSYSYYPESAPVTDLSSFQPNIEAIAEFDPDLVLLSYDPGDVVNSFDLLGIPVLLFDAAADIDGIYHQIEVLGVATGNIGAAAELVGQMQADIADILAGIADQGEGLTYFHELDDTFYTVTSTTFIGQVYGLLGLVNIADAADPDGSSGGYPQLSEEFIIDADPDLIFLADAACCGQSAETVAARPGWGGLRAVSTGGVVEVDEDVASRWGPRVVEYLRAVADSIESLEPVS